MPAPIPAPEAVRSDAAVPHADSKAVARIAIAKGFILAAPFGLSPRKKRPFGSKGSTPDCQLNAAVCAGNPQDFELSGIAGEVRIRIGGRANVGQKTNESSPSRCEKPSAK
jgi:hypothetical protein